MFRSLLVSCFLLASSGAVLAADAILNPINTFDITLSGQNYGAGFSAGSANTYYTMSFEAEVSPGVWTNVGSNGVYVTTTGVKSISVSLANKPWAPGTYHNGRVRLLIAGVAVDTKTGTFRN